MKYLLILVAIVYSYTATAQSKSTQTKPTTVTTPVPSVTTPPATTKPTMVTTPTATTKPQDDPTLSKSEQRKKDREAKRAAYSQFLDSLVMSKNFTFTPRDFSMQPAGKLRQIPNPQFRVIFYADQVDIFLPYYKGFAPPYVTVVLNYTVDPQKYTFKKTEHGWDVYFETSLFSPNNYRFKFSINTTTGTTDLDLESDDYNTVSYSGDIQAL